MYAKTTDSRPKLVAGSAEGYSGHVDGKLREVRMNHPKGLTVDDRGNIYIADTMNMAIRKIGDAGKSHIRLVFSFVIPALRSICSSFLQGSCSIMAMILCFK